MRLLSMNLTCIILILTEAARWIGFLGSPTMRSGSKRSWTISILQIFTDKGIGINLSYKDTGSEERHRIRRSIEFTDWQL